MKKLLALVSLFGSLILVSNSFAGGGSSIGVANPAAVACVNLNGKLETYRVSNGKDANCVIEQWQQFKEMAQRGLVKSHNYNNHNGSIGMPNPAAVNCIEIGGKLRVESSVYGQNGMCVIPQWTLFRILNAK